MLKRKKEEESIPTYIEVTCHQIILKNRNYVLVTKYIYYVLQLVPKSLHII